MSSSAPGRSS